VEKDNKPLVGCESSKICEGTISAAIGGGVHNYVGGWVKGRPSRCQVSKDSPPLNLSAREARRGHERPSSRPTRTKQRWKSDHYDNSKCSTIYQKKQEEEKKKVRNAK